MINIKDIFVGETVRVKNDDYEYYVKVHLIDEDNGQVYCSDEVLGISMWHDIENIKKLSQNNINIIPFLKYAAKLRKNHHICKCLFIKNKNAKQK